MGRSPPHDPDDCCATKQSYMEHAFPYLPLQDSNQVTHRLRAKAAMGKLNTEPNNSVKQPTFWQPT